MAIQTPYLDAIQAIPGDTLSEKFRWIAKLTKDRLRECNDLEEVAEEEKIPRPLAPLIQVQAALMLNKKDPTNQKSYEVIAEALKSKDEMIVNKAFEASSFFDGSNRIVTSVQYFFENLFPFVSLNTRTRIIKLLANHLASKDPELAECFFVAVATAYGFQQAMPLLLACTENFMYNTILKKRIVLNRKQIKDLFRKNPDFVVRYFRLSKSNNDPFHRDLHNVNLNPFSDFLAALIKKRLEAFVELYEMNEKCRPSVTLSNKCAESFLKNGKEHLQRNPKLYIKILPLKLISAKRMDSIFAKLFPEDAKDFETDKMLEYLQFYPQEKKLDLFLNTYRQVYGRNLLDSSSNVTPTLLNLLPTEERIKQARIQLTKESVPTKTINYLYCWRSYLPTEESIPYFKEEISKTPEMDDRAVILCQMIFCCKVNNDNQTLLNVLTYIRDRHRNEQYWLTLKVFECLLDIYDLPQMSENHWAILMEMILRAYVKNDLPFGNSISERIVEAAIHFKIIHEQSIDQLIDVLVDMKTMRYRRNWNILRKYPEYERMCLEACLTVISQKYDSDKEPWSTDKVGVLHDLCDSIYEFNNTHVKKNSRIERMSVKNYPWILEKISELVSSSESHDYNVMNLKYMLQTNEKDLYERFWPTEKGKIAEVESGDALKLLRSNPESILARWQDYLKACQTNWSHGQTKRFVRATRWYKEIPVRFVEQCLQDLTEKANDGCLSILATLVNGDTFVKIIEPLIPTGKTVEIHEKEAKLNYFQVVSMITASKMVNPPLPLQLVARLLEGDYLSLALVILVNTCRRTSTMEVIQFANMLANQRVSVKKHGIRMMHMVAPKDQFHQFLLAKWKSEGHQSIREVLFSKASQVFSSEPDQATWTMFTEIISTLMVNESSALNALIKMLNVIPDEYVADLVKLILKTMDKYADAGYPDYQITSNIVSLLNKIDAAICKLLPQDFVGKLLQRFLFHPQLDISEAAASFATVPFLLAAKDEELDDRMTIFSNIFVQAVKNGWNVPHPKQPFFYPVNYMVGEFVVKLVDNCYYFDAPNPRLIDGILKTFSSTLTPQMDPTSYLLLRFLKEYLGAKTAKNLGIKIGQMMPELIELFSIIFVFFISTVIETLINHLQPLRLDDEESKLSLIEGLMKVESIGAVLLAANLFNPGSNKNYWDRYEKLLSKFKKCDHAAVKSIVCDILNKTTVSTEDTDHDDQTSFKNEIQSLPPISSTNI